MQKYKTISTLGDGAFGTVYKATNIKTGELVAIKKMKQKYTSWNQCVQLREIKSLRKFNHDNIMKLKEVLLVAEELYMVFEYLQYNIYEVYARMKESGKKFTQAEIKSIVYQIVNGLAHIHKNGFFHRDLKPQNILIFNNVVKLCDFGLARQIRSRPPFTDYVSTRWYRAPQLLLRSTCYNSPVDIFALGCIMVELYTLTPLFPGNNQIDQMNKIVKILGTPTKEQWPEGYKMAQSKNYYFPTQPRISLCQIIPQASPQAIDLIECMLKYSCRKRLTASQQDIYQKRILKHQFFKDVKLPVVQPKKQQIIFQQRAVGQKLDTVKQDKKMDVFRSTKERFKQIRQNQANQNNPFKQYQNLRLSKLIDTNQSILNGNKENQNQLDSLIKQLQEKGNKKLKQSKSHLQSLPFLQNAYQKQKKLYSDNELDRQQRRTQMHTEPLKTMQKDRLKYQRTAQNPLRKKQSIDRCSRTQVQANSNQNKLFSYSFQPATLISNSQNIFIGSKSPSKKKAAYGAILPKVKSLISEPYYKF